MVRAGRPAITSNALALDGLGMAELLGSDLIVTWVAQVAGVTILVTAAQGERDDMIHHGSEDCQALLIAAFTQTIGAGEAALALGLAGTAAKALNHRGGETRRA